jgi:TolB-like protein/class 3 adenylate cyclase/Tfp pilus assembly protein PilF
MADNHRRLAAIMFTDIVGYSSLVHDNEALAQDLLEEHWRLIRPLVEEHHGREIKTIGDAFHIEFSSALQAVRCAIEIQSVLHGHNLGVSPERQILVRIGIHVGDVEEVDGDIYGDGVNIAARLESLADPGGICISEQVYAQIANKLETLFSDLGRLALKNIAQPVQAYTILLPWHTQSENDTVETSSSVQRTRTWYAIGVASILILAAAAWWYFNPSQIAELPTGGEYSITSLAILPFEDMSPDKDNEYFCDGLAEELINAFAKHTDFQVVARTSSFAFKGKNEDIRGIGQKLKASVVMEGSVRKADRQLRITAQLIRVSDGYHLWSETYDRELDDVFEIQEDIALSVVQALKGGGERARDDRLVNATTNSPQAHDLYLWGRFAYNKRTPESIEQSIPYFIQAIELDPTYALAYTGLADAYLYLVIQGWVPPDEYLSLGTEAALKAVELQGELPEAHISLFMLRWMEGNFMEAERAILNALNLSPNSAEAHMLYANLLTDQGKEEEAFEEFKVAWELDPFSAQKNSVMGTMYRRRGQYDEATSFYLKTLEIDPLYLSPYGHLATLRILEWDWKGAKEQYLRALNIDPAYITALNGLAWLRIYHGQFSEGISIFESVVEISASRFAFDNLGLAYFLSQQYADALAAFEHVVQIEPNYVPVYVNMAQLFIVTEQWEDAKPAIEHAESMAIISTLVEMMSEVEMMKAIYYAETKDSDLAHNQLALLLDRARDPTTHYLNISTMIASVYVSFGEFDEAFRWLESAFESREDRLLRIKTDPYLSELRSDARYTALLTRMGLAD